MGNSITRIIVTCCLNEQADTISSIKFAQRAQRVQTHPEILTLKPRDKEIKSLKDNL